MTLTKNQTAITAHRLTNRVNEHSYGLLSGIDLKEMFLYSYLLYALLGNKLGIDAPFLGFAWLTLLAFWAFFERGQNNLQRLFLGLIFITSAVFLFIQFFIYNLNIDNPYIKPFIIWPLMAVVIFGFINRPGFIKRLSLVIFLTVLISWPSVVWEYSSHGIARAWAEGTGFANSNDFAAWAGFCVLIFWLWGLEQRCRITRIILWFLAILGLVILMQTVSRGVIVCLGVAFLLSLFPLKIKRKLVIIISCLGLGFIAMSSPIFQERTMDYQARMYDETGRLVTLPVALMLFAENPGFGIGVDKLELEVPGRSATTPHNGFLVIAISSGILPLIPFTILWLLMCRNAIKFQHESVLNPLPLAIFVLGETLVSNLYFVSIWSVTIIFYCAIIYRHPSIIIK